MPSAAKSPTMGVPNHQEHPPQYALPYGIRVGVDVVSNAYGEDNMKYNGHFLKLVHNFVPAWSLANSPELRTLMVEEICKLIHMGGTRTSEGGQGGRFIDLKTGQELSGKCRRRKVRRALNDAKERLRRRNSRQPAKKIQQGITGRPQEAIQVVEPPAIQEPLATQPPSGGVSSNPGIDGFSPEEAPGDVIWLLDDFPEQWRTLSLADALRNISPFARAPYEPAKISSNCGSDHSLFTSEDIDVLMSTTTV